MSHFRSVQRKIKSSSAAVRYFSFSWLVLFNKIKTTTKCCTLSLCKNIKSLCKPNYARYFQQRNVSCPQFLIYGTNCRKLCFFETFSAWAAKVAAWWTFSGALAANFPYYICLVLGRNNVVRMLLVSRCTVRSQTTFWCVQILHHRIRETWWRSVDRVVPRPHWALIRRSSLMSNIAWMYAWAVMQRLRCL